MRAGDHLYPDHQDVPKRLDAIVQEYNQSKESLFSKAVKFFFAVIDLHPFGDGNGRICRLLAAYSLIKDGVPFPV